MTWVKVRVVAGGLVRVLAIAFCRRATCVSRKVLDNRRCHVSAR